VLRQFKNYESACAIEKLANYQCTKITRPLLSSPGSREIRSCTGGVEMITVVFIQEQSGIVISRDNTLKMFCNYLLMYVYMFLWHTLKVPH
jgi:hypothetical protein